MRTAGAGPFCFDTVQMSRSMSDFHAHDWCMSACSHANSMYIDASINVTQQQVVSYFSGDMSSASQQLCIHWLYRHNSLFFAQNAQLYQHCKHTKLDRRRLIWCCRYTCMLSSLDLRELALCFRRMDMQINAAVLKMLMAVGSQPLHSYCSSSSLNCKPSVCPFSCSVYVFLTYSQA